MSQKKKDYPKVINKETEIIEVPVDTELPEEDAPATEEPAAIEPEESPAEVAAESQASEAYAPNPIHWKG